MSRPAVRSTGYRPLFRLPVAAWAVIALFVYGGAVGSIRLAENLIHLQVALFIGLAN